MAEFKRTTPCELSIGKQQEIETDIDLAIQHPEDIVFSKWSENQRHHIARLENFSLAEAEFFLRIVQSRLLALSKGHNIDTQKLTNETEDLVEHEMTHIRTMARLSGLTGVTLQFELLFVKGKEEEKGKYLFTITLTPSEKTSPTTQILTALAPSELSEGDIRYIRRLIQEHKIFFLMRPLLLLEIRRSFKAKTGKMLRIKA